MVSLPGAIVRFLRGTNLDVERFDREFCIRWLGEKEELPILDTRAGVVCRLHALRVHMAIPYNVCSSRGGRER